MHPHPMFSSWAKQIDWYVNKFHPDIGTYAGVDAAGHAFCGRVGDPLKRSGVVEVVGGVWMSDRTPPR